MKQRQFEERHEDDWQALEAWLEARENRRAQPPEDFSEAGFPARFRRLATQLALAKERHYTPPLLARLNRLALRAHQQFYRVQLRPWHYFYQFLTRDFPRRVRADRHFVGLAALVFFGPLLAMLLAIQFKPHLVYHIMDAQQVLEMQAMYDPTAEHHGRNREADSDFLMFGFYIRNNIGISFQTFASGLLLGLGSLFFLTFNGLFIGTVAGHLTRIDYGEPFYAFVAGHSGPELGAIVIAGAAGLKLGWALIAPGRYRRLHALQRAAGQSMILMYGDMLLLTLAAFIEAFWSSNAALPPTLRYAVGISIWLLLLAYITFAGRRGG